MELENMKKKNKTLMVVLFVLILLILVVSGYYVYTKYINKGNAIKEDIKNDEKFPDESKVEDDKEVFERIKTIIDKELYVFNKLDSTNDLNPSIKAFLAIDLYCEDTDDSSCKHGDDSNVQTVKASDLKDAYMNSSLSKFEFKNTSIPCILYWDNPDHYAWTYNQEEDNYKYTEIGHGGMSTSAIDKKLVKEIKENNLYTVSYKYLWTVYGDFEEPLKIYATYENASKLQNPIATIEDGFNKEELINTYAKEESVFNSLDTYNYTFELVNNELKLKEFSRN